jgi:hypothetical protein
MNDDDLPRLLRASMHAISLHDRAHRIAIGRLLISMHGHGYGSFLKTVTEPPPAGLGISYKTRVTTRLLRERPTVRPAVRRRETSVLAGLAPKEEA